MLHPILETLFFLKVARESIVESIKVSEVEDKSSLISYIQNEASDFEVMHLLTIGEMPDEKFNVQAENAVWDIFREAVIFNSPELRKDMLKEDIMNIVYEMGPVSTLGYSSAAPILEFDRANGRLSLDYLREDSAKDKDFDEKQRGFNNSLGQGKRRGTQSQIQTRTARAGTRTNSGGMDDKRLDSNVGGTDSNTTAQRDKALDKKVGSPGPSTMDKIKNFASNPANQKAAGYAAGGAVAAAGLFGLYKLYKGWKAKKAAANTPEAKAAAAKGMAKVQAKIKAKKAKK